MLKNVKQNLIVIIIFELTGDKSLKTPYRKIREYFSFGIEQYYPYTLMLDFKCILTKINKQIANTTKYILKQIVNGFCLYYDDMKA